MTKSPVWLGKDLPGIIDPDQIEGGAQLGAKAVLLDEQLDADSQQKVSMWCDSRGIPCLAWQCTDSISESDVLKRFLLEQNQADIPHEAPLDQIKWETLIDIITTANSLLEPGEVMHLVMTRIAEIIECEAWSVLLTDNEEEEQTLSFAAAFPAFEELESIRVPIGEGIAGWVAKYRQPLIVRDTRDDPRFLDQIDKDTHFVTRNILCAPLNSRGRTIGVIEMLNRRGEISFSQADLELLQVLVNPAAVAIENAFLFQRAQTLTIQDDLTKLYNSRHLNQCLEQEIMRSKRSGKPLSLIFLDLDGFKAVNDNYGHLQGSQSLVAIGEIIREAARQTDIVGRYGGDEFMLILPETDTEGAVTVGERIRERIQAYCMLDIALTASIGIASFPQHGDSRESLIRWADKAMYLVKEKGKNGILVLPPDY